MPTDALLEAEPICSLATDKPRPRHTAERVLRTRPKDYRKCVQLLAQGETIDSITLACRMSEHTIYAIREREARTIAERKSTLISIFANVAEVSAERMEQLASKSNINQAGIAAGIATDKLMLLSGEPTQRIEVQLKSEDIYSELRTIQAEIIQATAVDAELLPALPSATESSPAIGYPAPAIPPQKGNTAADPASKGQAVP